MQPRAGLPSSFPGAADCVNGVATLATPRRWRRSSGEGASMAKGGVRADAACLSAQTEGLVLPTGEGGVHLVRRTGSLRCGEAGGRGAASSGGQGAAVVGRGVRAMSGRKGDVTEAYGSRPEFGHVQWNFGLKLFESPARNSIFATLLGKMVYHATARHGGTISHCFHSDLGPGVCSGCRFRYTGNMLISL